MSSSAHEEIRDDCELELTTNCKREGGRGEKIWACFDCALPAGWHIDGRAGACDRVRLGGRTHDHAGAPGSWRAAERNSMEGRDLRVRTRSRRRPDQYPPDVHARARALLQPPVAGPQALDRADPRGG